jgi:HEAT repeats
MEVRSLVEGADLRRALWPLGLVVAFGLGVAAAAVVFRPGSSASREVEELRAAKNRLQLQVSALQAQLRAREARLFGQQGFTFGHAGASGDTGHAASVRPERRFLARFAPDERARPEGLAQGTRGRSEPQSDRASAGRATGPAVLPVPTVDAALERFSRYFNDTSESGRGSRWQRVRELADDLRAMGNAGSEALLRVLADGTSTEERRLAAQLAGELQVAQALPLLQNILDKDSDVLLRRAAALGLRRLETPDAAPVMQALLANPAEDRFVRMSAAYGLAQLGQALGVAGLVQIFDESAADGRGRDMAFRALSSLNDERSLPFMRQLLTSNADVSYRLQAIRFLAAQGDRQALVPLEFLMQSPTEQPSIRDAAAQAHATIAAK